MTLRFEVGGRLDAPGIEVEPYDGQVLRGLLDAWRHGEVDAVAVCLLHADLDPAHERAVSAAPARVRPTDGCDVLVLARGVARVPRVRADRHHRRSTPALAPVCRPYLEARGRARRRRAW